MRPQSENNIVLDFQILGIGIVLNMEEILHLFHTCRSQVDNLVLFIDNKISRLLLNHTHNGIHFGQFLHVLTTLHTPRQKVTHFIQGGGFTALSRYNQRGSGLINKYRVHLVNNTEMQIPQHQLLLVDHPVIPQIIKSQFIIGHISNVTLIRPLTLLRTHAVEHNTHGKSQKFMHLSHPLRVTLRQIVIDRHHMDSLAFQRIQISRQNGRLCFSFPGAHLGNTSLMEHNPPHQLHTIMLRIQHPSCRLPGSSICLGQ